MGSGRQDEGIISIYIVFCKQSLNKYSKRMLSAKLSISHLASNIVMRIKPRSEAVTKAMRNESPLSRAERKGRAHRKG